MNKNEFDERLLFILNVANVKEETLSEDDIQYIISTGKSINKQEDRIFNIKYLLKEIKK